MSNLTDPEKIKAVIESLGETANSFANKLGYKSHQSVYFVINGTNSLSVGMRNRILEKYPQVNANFLTHGSLPVILTGVDLQAQMNLLGEKSAISKSIVDIQDFVGIPSQLNRIESLLEKIAAKIGLDEEDI